MNGGHFPTRLVVVGSISQGSSAHEKERFEGLSVLLPEHAAALLCLLVLSESYPKVGIILGPTEQCVPQ